MSEEQAVETTQPSVEGKSADDLKSMLMEPPAEPPKEEAPKEEPKAEPAKQEPVKEEPKKEDDWFDRDRGFKTKEDAIKSYTNLQNTLRERAEREKQLQGELDQLKQKAQERPLTVEEKERQEAVQNWKEENKDAIEFLKKEIRSDIEKETHKKTYEETALGERKKWKEEFDKDDSRKALWPVMEEIYAKQDVPAEFFKNPFPFLEAMAFKQNFSSIAEQIRAEAVEQYKASIKEADEAAKQNATGRPGGSKKAAGEIDPSKMSSSELGSLLPRNEDG